MTAPTRREPLYNFNLDRVRAEFAAENASRRRVGVALPREHGSQRGYDQHRYRKERPCPDCSEAHSKDNTMRRLGLVMTGTGWPSRG